MLDSCVWVTWERQRRSTVLAEELGCELFIYEKKHGSRISRYFFAIFSTTLFLIKKKPNIVFCQNPSIVLAAFLCFTQPLFRYKLIVDRHSNFMFNRPKDLLYKLFIILSDYTIRKADLTIVTNEYLNDYVKEKGGRGFVLQDKIPEINFYNKKNRDKAIQELDAFVSRFPSEKGSLMLAMLYEEKNVEEAFTYIEDALDSFPHYHTMRNFLGKIYYNEKNYERALEIWESSKNKNKYINRLITDAKEKMTILP